jgi:hypothetical protein
MDKLEQLFQHRERQYKSNTDRILNSMSKVIDGVVQFLSLKEELAQGQLTWQNIQMQDEVVMLIGFIEYPPGAKFTTTTGEEMVVSRENRDYFKRILRLGLPVDLVKKGEAQDVVDWLTGLSNQEEQEVEMVELPEELAGIKDFNLDDLTPEQKLALTIKEDDGTVH